MKVFVVFILMAILVNCEKLKDNDKFKDLNKTVEKEVHKRGVYHREPYLTALTYPTHNSHFAPQAAFWPKAYAPHFGYNLRTLGVPAFAPTIFKQKPLFASPAIHSTPYVLRPGGASVSSYSATFPRYHAKHFYAIPQPIQPAIEAPAAVPTHFVHTNFAAAAAPVPEPIQPQFVQHNFIPPQHAPDCFVRPVTAPPSSHFVQTSFIPPQNVPAPVFSPLPAPPEFPAVSFAPEGFVPQIPQVPQAPQIPQPPQTPTIPSPPTPPPVSFLFPVNFQPPTPQAPPTFLSNPVGVDFPNFTSVSNNPPPQQGSAVASPQIPAPQPPNEVQPNEFPTAQQPPLQTETPWRPLYTPPSENERPTITLQPPYNSPSNAYLPPSGPQAQQVINHASSQYQHNNYYDVSDDEIAHLFHQAKYVPHHANHLSRYHH